MNISEQHWGHTSTKYAVLICTVILFSLTQNFGSTVPYWYASP
jgi:hypothetical protein